MLLLLGGVLAGVWVFAPMFDVLAPTELRREPPAERAERARRVLLVSIDGLAPWVLEQTPTPFLDGLAAEGFAARRAETVVPAITMTSHASMLSGLSPDEHGVFFNRYQPWSEFRAPTLFTDCAKAALRCGLFAGKRKFAHFAENEPGVERYAFAEDAAGVLEAARAWSAEADPDLLVVHLAEVDLVGHAEGWGSDAQAAAVEDLDAQLGAFVEAWRGQSARSAVVLVTADHGGLGTRHHQDLPENRRIPWILWGADAPAAHGVRPLSTRDTHATIRALLAP